MDPAVDTSATPPPPPPGFGGQPVSTAPPPPPPGFGGQPVSATPQPPATPPATPQQTSWLQSIKNHVTALRAENEPMFQAHPALRAIDDIVNSPTEFAIGAGKGVIGGLGGLLKIIHDVGSSSGDPSDVMAYQKANPGATPEQAVQAVNKGYRTPEKQPSVDRLRDASNFLMTTGKTHGFFQGAGSTGELMAELFGPLAGEAAPVAAGEVTDAAGKALTTAQRYTNKAKAVQFLADNPLLAKLTGLGAAALHAGVKGAAEMGAQTYLHTGGDPEATKTATELGGAGSALLGPAGEWLGSKARGLIPAVENIMGEDVPTLSSQRAAAAGGPSGSIGIDEVPSYKEAQQAAAPRVFRTIAQQATFNALEDANATRFAGLPADTSPPQFTLHGIPPEVENVPGEVIPGRKQQVGSRVVYGKGAADQPNVSNIRGPFPLSGIDREAPPKPLTETEQWLQDMGVKPVEQIGSRKPAITRNVEGPVDYHKEPLYQYMPPKMTEGYTNVSGGGGDIITNSPELAARHLNVLNSILDNPPKSITSDVLDEMAEHRDELQQQLHMHFLSQAQMPSVPRVNAAFAANLVGDYGDAHDQMQQALGPYMARINTETQGAVQDVLNTRMTAARRGDLSGYFNADSKLDNLIDNSETLNPNERTQVNNLRDKARIFGGLNTVVEHAANVEDASAAQLRGGRVLSGTRLGNGLDTLAEKFGSGDRDRGVNVIKSVIGDDGWNAMRRMQDILNVPEKAKENKYEVPIHLGRILSKGKFLAALGALAGHATGLPEGALFGAATGVYVQKELLKALATSPRALSLYEYGIRNGVKPEILTPFVTKELMDENNNPSGVLNRTAQTDPRDVAKAAIQSVTPTPPSSSAPVSTGEP